VSVIQFTDILISEHETQNKMNKITDRKHYHVPAVDECQQATTLTLR
jgi:hypothetical protein